jgi:hypothetical protein
MLAFGNRGLMKSKSDRQTQKLVTWEKDAVGEVRASIQSAIADCLNLKSELKVFIANFSGKNYFCSQKAATSSGA